MDPIAKIASNASDLGAAFSTFAEEISPGVGKVSAADILAVTSKFYNISAVLLRLEALLPILEYRHNYERIRDDLQIVRQSLQFTLQDVYGMLAEVKARELQGSSTRTACYYTWRNITQTIEQETGDSLLTRLQIYDGFLVEMVDEFTRRYVL